MMRMIPQSLRYGWYTARWMPWQRWYGEEIGTTIETGTYLKVSHSRALSETFRMVFGFAEFDGFAKIAGLFQENVI